MNEVTGNIVDIFNRVIYPGKVLINNHGKIHDIIKSANVDDFYLIPGFVDSHVHIESSMLTPVQFGKQAFKHGTVAVVSDPHEIANVCGIDGIQFMLNNAKQSCLKYFFGVPSCVPATNYDINGFEIDSKSTKELFSTGKFYFLSEMMNFPGVINEDKEVISKLNIAKKYCKVVDGHAPGLTGNDLKKYIKSGISTDHECSTLKEAIEKINYGMKILIREGSAAKNFNELSPLIDLYPDMIMFCTDDCHPDDLIKGHINSIVQRAISMKYDLFNILKAACINPVLHYNLPVGLLKQNDPADFIVIDNLNKFNVLKTYINGKCISNDKIEITKSSSAVNKFNAKKIGINDLKVKVTGSEINVINFIENEIITKKTIEKPCIENNFAVSNTKNDLLKIIYYNRYIPSSPKIGFVKNFGLKKGAVAQSISHDNHNIVCIGCNDTDIVNAINQIVDMKGGIAYSNGNYICKMPLEIGGIMTNASINKLNNNYLEINNELKRNGCKQHSPLMTLSFVALIVIPEIKIGDQGLFDVKKFKFINLFVD